MGLVVGAAMVRHGQVLAARRTRPAEAAGRWELPGGKVEPGEDPAEALVREVDEELGVTAVVTAWLDGEHPVGGGRHVLRVAQVEATGVPEPTEHDAVRWLGPEELDDVDWLDPDRPFLVELRERLLDGEPLVRGRAGGAVRVGGTVRRATGPWTPAVHAYLEHLRARGLPGVPRVHGIDARGREVLDHLPGEPAVADGDPVPEARLAVLAAWARELHEAAAGFDHPGPWRLGGLDGATVVAHNDLAPAHARFEGDRLTGVLGWDLAGPSTPRMELARLAWTAVPLCRDLPPEPVAARLRLLAASYGGRCAAADVLAAVEPRVRLTAGGEQGRTARALAGFLARRSALARLVQD